MCTSTKRDRQHRRSLSRPYCLWPRGTPRCYRPDDHSFTIPRARQVPLRASKIGGAVVVSVLMSLCSVCALISLVGFSNGFSPQDNEHLSVLMEDVYDTLPAPVCSFKLAVVFAVLAMGMEASARDDVVSDSASAYHLLARAAACLPSSGIDCDVNLITALVCPMPCSCMTCFHLHVQFFMIAYLLIFRDDEANMLAARGILNVSARVCNEVITPPIHPPRPHH